MVKKRKLNKAKKRKRFYKANRNHKSSLFCLSFREKEHLLELCNDFRFRSTMFFITEKRMNQTGGSFGLQTHFPK